MAQVTIHNADGDIVDVVGKHLLVLATVESEFEHISEEDSLSFSWSMLGVDLGAGAQTALLLQNTSDSLLLHIQTISFSMDTASEVDIHLTNETALTHSGTNVIGVCLNRAATKVASATATADEANNVQGNIIWSNQIAADTVHIERYAGSLILGKNDIVAVDITDDVGNTNCVITGYFKET